MYDYRRSGGVFGAFILGGAIGAVLGLLFAPRAGKDSREMLADAAEKYWSDGRELCETGVSKATGAYESGREVAVEKADELRDKIDAARDRLREQVEGASNVARERVAEAVPTAKEVTHKVAEAVKTGAEAADKKAQEALDLVAERTTPKPGSTSPSTGAGSLPPL